MDEGILPDVLALRPGVEVVRRDARWLQVGLGPDGVALPDHPDVRDLLLGLEAGRALPDVSVARQCCLRLWRAGLLVDAAACRSDRVRWPRLAAAAYAEGPAAGERLDRRARARIGLAVEPEWRGELDPLLVANGLHPGGGDGADAHLVAGFGELDRSRLDELMSAGAPHLVVRSSGGILTLGPFVVPGRTACLRCEDAHRCDLDPRWPVLLAQLPSRLSPRATRACPPEPALLTLGLAWAVRDLATFVEGGRPATWSTTISVGPGLDLPRRELLRHPHCGCAWDDLMAVG